ncbi:hypothetical protein GQ55_4G108500 [Panicum hallii var. hallii]|uniref:Uncharacterized protein n=1 Tax=Panicum hallii var. hallii TaxID=1504633 RepID=A0A2T7DXE2_9POAL|nr:hypothetical protein GQ55_4G108500 [Panicum hallii var. hallii]
MIRLPLDQVRASGRRIRLAVCSTNCGNFVKQREGLPAVFQWLPVEESALTMSWQARAHGRIARWCVSIIRQGIWEPAIMDVKDLGVLCARAAQRWIRF